MNSLLTIKAAILVFALVLFSAITNAQTSSQNTVPDYKLYDVSFKDSLIANEHTSVLTNTLRLRNNGKSKKAIRVAISVRVPKGWKDLTNNVHIDGNEIYYNLFPEQEKVIPLNILKTTKAIAGWNSVVIKVRLRDYDNSAEYYYHIMSTPQPSVSAQALDDDQLIIDNSQTQKLTVHVKNTGNIKDIYRLEWKNRALELNDSVRIALEPGQDTTIDYTLRVKNALWNNFYKEKIQFNVKGAGVGGYSHDYTVIKPTSVLKENNSAYNTIPITLEGGSLTYGDRITYFGGFRGRYEFKNSDNLNFYYRSKQFGNVLSGYQQDVLKIHYKHNHWNFIVGQVDVPLYFLVSNLRGASIGYQSDRYEASITATMHDPNLFYQNDNLTAIVKYPVGKINLKQIVSLNQDLTNYLNSYVLVNEAEIIHSGPTTLKVMLGGGADEKIRNVANVEKQTLGYLAGYLFSSEKGKWFFNSSVKYHSEDFPGINKGVIVQLHDITWRSASMRLGVFCNSNTVHQNYFRDSLYNTDIIYNNTTRYGVRIERTFNKRLNLGFSTGLLYQNGAASLIGNAPYSYFVDMNHSWYISPKAFASLNSQSLFTHNVFATSANTIINTKYVGFNAIYTRTPTYDHDGSGKEVLNTYLETVNGGPFVNFYLFRNKLTGSIRYNFSKTINDNAIVQGMGGTLNYVNPKKAVTVQFNCFAPFQAQTNDPGLPIANRNFAQLSVIKQINIPLIGGRRYHSLTLSLYADDNNNGVKDYNEKPIKDAQISINGEQLISNERGEIKYKNIPGGNYVLNMLNSNNEGFVPVNGINQNVVVNNRNTSMSIAFKKGKRLTGKIGIVMDSLSNLTMSSSRIKVTATDSSGHKFSTVTNAEGEYSINLPAGIYSVSLNPAAFENSDFKPVIMSFDNIDLMKKQEDAVNFTIKQRTRKVRFLDSK